jgi:hypothetical protein
MSTERPSRGMLVFQCDSCYDEQHEFSRAEGDDVQNFQSCWSTLREEGWGIMNSEHLCPDCFKKAKADNENPFRR